MASTTAVLCLLLVIGFTVDLTSGQAKLLGSDCSTSDDCKDIGNSLCGTRKGIDVLRCYCIDGYRPSDDLTACVFVDVTRFAKNTLNVGEWAGLFIGLSIVILVAVSCIIHFRNKHKKAQEV